MFVVAWPIVYVVCDFTTSGVLYVQPVSRAGYSNVSQRPWAVLNDVSTEFDLSLYF